jgi:hypothetical protein
MRVRLIFLMVGVLAAAMMMSAAAPAQDREVQFGLRTGYYVGTDGPFVGMEVTVPFLPLFIFNPNIEAAFGNDRDTFSMNADAYIELPLPSPSSVWFGGGPAVLVRNYDQSPSHHPGRPPHYKDDDVNLGFNLLSGVGWRTGNGSQFYFQGKFVIAGDPEGVFSFGVRF